MAKKLIFGDQEFAVLQKVLRANPPAQTTLDGAEMYFYRRVLTQILGEDYRFPDTDDEPKEK